MSRNPFERPEEPLATEDAMRVDRIDKAYAALWEVLRSECTNPSRYLSIAVTDLEHSHAMAVKSVNTGFLP
jgi:hypothetical protein